MDLPNCKGCFQAAIGGAAANHTDACRLRIKNAMRADPDLSGRVRHSEDQREEKEATRQRAEVSPPNSGIPETQEVDMGTEGPAATLIVSRL